MKYKIYVLASTEFGWPQNAPHQNSTIMGTPQTPLGFFYKNQQEIFNRIATNTLKIPYTWETEMSELGKKNFSSEIEKQTL